MRLPEASQNDGDLNSAYINPGDRPALLTAWRDPALDLSLCFQRLADFDRAVLERLHRDESALARQMVQLLLLLHPVRRR
jgi:hypothetical protein